MPQIKSTRLRSIRASTTGELETAVERLPFRVEIKGAPVRDGDAWVLFFTISDDTPKLDSVDLTS